MSDVDDPILVELGRILDVRVPETPDDRIAAIRAAALAARRHQPEVRMVGISTRRALLMTTAAAAVGAVGTAVLVNENRADAPAASPGPPTEALSFSSSDAEVAGSTVSGEVVNHTWGVELILEATGFPVGTRYEVVYVDSDASDVGAGGFVGAPVAIHCRCNGPLLGDAIAAIEIRDPSGTVVSRAEFT